jgi:hypothetical protein
MPILLLYISVVAFLGAMVCFHFVSGGGLVLVFFMVSLSTVLAIGYAFRNRIALNLMLVIGVAVFLFSAPQMLLFFPYCSPFDMLLFLPVTCASILGILAVAMAARSIWTLPNKNPQVARTALAAVLIFMVGYGAWMAGVKLGPPLATRANSVMRLHFTSDGKKIVVSESRHVSHIFSTHDGLYIESVQTAELPVQNQTFFERDYVSDIFQRVTEYVSKDLDLKLTLHMKQNREVDHLLVSRNGNLLWTKSVTLWEKFMLGSNFSFETVAFAPDKTTVAVDFRRLVILYDTETGREVKLHGLIRGLDDPDLWWKYWSNDLTNRIDRLIKDNFGFYFCSEE